MWAPGRNFLAYYFVNLLRILLLEEHYEQIQSPACPYPPAFFPCEFFFQALIQDKLSSPTSLE